MTGRPRHGQQTGLLRDVRRILAEWRRTHGWKPGYTWNQDTGFYEPGRRDR